jgi:drug/metabolite transporter (DMT)-like permease
MAVLVHPCQQRKIAGVTELALVLVLLSAISHAAWNFIAKRASAGPVFNWLFDALSVLVCLPLGIAQVLIQPPHLGPIEWTFIVGSALLHLAYFLLLGQGYRVGDLSLVYPLARGLGPMLSTAAAVLLLGERPSALALAGAALVGIGVFVLAGNPRRVHAASVMFASLTGIVIAGYTLWDKQAVSDTGLAIPPVLYFYLFTVCRAAMLTPFALSRMPTLRREWRLHRRHALGIAVLSPLSYILVLYALSFSPVSYVAPVREIGILIGAVMGTRWLAEGHGRRRVAGAVAMVAGVVALAAG